MPRFVHIDHSLCRVGGHEYDCAMSTLQAAEAAGYRVSLATNRRFRDRSSLPAHWPVYPVFPHRTNTKHCVSYGGHQDLPIGLDGNQLRHLSDDTLGDCHGSIPTSGLAFLQRLYRLARRRSCIRSFAAACNRLFKAIELGKGDDVFFATISEFDLLGLASYLADDPRSQLANWRLQFHNDLFQGCGPNDPDVAQRRRAVRQQFEHALSHLPDHRLHFYNPTEELAAQYRQLGVAPFEYLPHPVSPFPRGRRRRVDKQLCVTCAGGVRREKGYGQLRALVESLRSESVFDGRIRLVAQIPKRKRRRLGIPEREIGGDKANIQLLALPHPLETEAYRRLIGRTDIGLFLYDNQRYRVRCSAVLQEMLAAGKPVIVPAASWLAEQISEPVFRHLETVRQTLPMVRCLHGSHVAWRNEGRSETGTAAANGNLSFTNSQLAAAGFSIPESANECMIAFRRLGSDTDNYICIQTMQFDFDGSVVGQFDSILGRRTNNEGMLTLIHLDPRAARITFRLRNAYCNKRLAITDVEVSFLDTRNEGGCPAGSVGLVAARPAQIPDLLRDMMEHYSHYRESAEAFAHCYRQRRHPARTIEILTSDAGKRAA